MFFMTLCLPLKALGTTSRKESAHEGHEDAVRRAFESHDRFSLSVQYKPVRCFAEPDAAQKVLLNRLNLPSRLRRLDQPIQME